MTYTIAARCPSTGKLGIAIATYSIVVGQLCDGIRANVGVTITQAFPRPGNHHLALKLLETGFAADHVLSQLDKDDRHASYRQICVLGRSGPPALYTGPNCRGWAGHLAGDDFAVFGNVLAGPKVVEAMRDGFNAGASEHSFEHRLIASLEAGRDAGGQAGKNGAVPERSAAIVVVDKDQHAELNLRVDLHDSAVHELRRLYEFYKPYDAYYRLRATDPAQGVPQEVFQAELERSRQAVSQPRAAAGK
jgi:uncharacterized Ntn-hydrolase superfamily protein